MGWYRLDGGLGCYDDVRILQFSGGIDSLATLWFLKETWSTLTVMWIDTGASYPETHEYMKRIKKLPIKGFTTVTSNQPSWIRDNGYPVDVVPMRATRIGHTIHGTEGMVFQGWLSCCSANIWQPGIDAAKTLGATVIYRGQRADDKKKAPIESGHVFEGITYEFPLEKWTRKQVRNFVEKECPDLIPEYYTAGEDSSHDCMDCTAFLEDNAVRINQLPGGIQSKIQHRLAELKTALNYEVGLITGVQHG